MIGITETSKETNKKSKLIKKHIARTVSSQEYGSGSYGSVLNNCQHLVNRCLLCLDISNEGTFRKEGNKSLKEEIIETNAKLDYLTIKNPEELKDKQRKINEYSAQIGYVPLWEWKKIVELKPRSDCKLQ